MPGAPIAACDSNFVPVVICVAGRPNRGKTTVAALLQSDTCRIFSCDVFSLLFYQGRMGRPCFAAVDPSSATLNLDCVGRIIDAQFADEFAEFVDARIEVDQPVTVLEGYALSLGNIWAAVARRLQRRTRYVWQLSRVG